MDKRAFLASSAIHRFLFVFFLIVILTFTPVIKVHAVGILYAKPIATGSGNCSSWSNACALQTALGLAVSGDEIWVGEGVHYPGTSNTDTFTLKNSVAVFGGFAGTETQRDQRDWEVNISVLSGDIDQDDVNSDGNFVAEISADINGDNAIHVVTGSLTNNTAILDGFVVTAGQADGTYPLDAGGGMFNQNGSPQLTNLVFSGNFAGGGGGMFNHASQPVLTGVTFIGNTAIDGGGMQNDHYSHPVLINVDFFNNSATRNGGAIANGGDNTDPVLKGVRIENNSATNGGGGIYSSMYNSTVVLLTDVIFKGNHAYEGGGMNNHNVSPTLVNSIFQDNSAAYGGGIYNDTSAMEAINVTFTANTASAEGGAMYSYWTQSPRLKNAILWGNDAPVGPEIYIFHSGTLITYSDIEGCGGSGTG